jgi:transcriptional regulator GlxA family with amidase domain
MRTFTPRLELSAFVRCFEVIETTEEMTRTLLPDTGLVVGFRYAGSATSLDAGAPRLSPHSAIVGLRSTARRMRTSVGGGMVVARLRAAHSGRFFGESVHELFGETLSLDQVARPRDVASASSRIMGAQNDAERIAIFEELLLAISRPWRSDPHVLRALHAIDQASGSVRVSALARVAALSQDALEKRFRRSVGATPKQYASIVRLRRAVAAYGAAKGTAKGTARSLTQISFDAGYCDQSHFTRHFRQVTGEAPRDFLASAAFC